MHTCRNKLLVYIFKRIERKGKAAKCQAYMVLILVKREITCLQNQQSSLPDCEGAGGDSVCEGKGSEEVDQQDKTPLSPDQPDHIVGKSITHLLVIDLISALL